ncbi:MAG: ferritin family protein [Desulfobacterales bacterium]
MFSAREILDIAIRLEKNGETVYRGAIKKLSDPNLSLLLEWMADEEARHARCFSRMQQKLTLEPPNPMAEEMGHDLLNNLLAGQNFSLEDVDFSRIDHINTMIATFIEFEEDTILFYRMLETFIQDESALQELNEIVAEEERHIEKLKSLMHRETLATSGG